MLTKTKAPGFLRLVFHDAGTFDEGDKTGIVLRTSTFSSSRIEMLDVGEENF